MRITGRTVFIAGATSGIGLGMAVRFLDAGNVVIVGGRRVELLERMAHAHPGLHTIEIDVADADSVERARARLAVDHPSIDVLVTMAGIMLPEDLLDPGHMAVAEQTIATNLLGSLRLVSAFLPVLVRQPVAQIMLVTSGLAFVPLPSTPTYSATKAALHSYAQSLRVQLASTPVEVIELAPPAVRTTLMGQQDSKQAMPLDEFLDEAFALLQADPDATEIVVERARFFRDAEREGRSDEVLELLAGH